jgi:hypothetical protein
MGFSEQRAAYLAGDGDVAAVLAALREITVWMPVDVEGRVFTLMFGGLPWLVAFTSVDRLRNFMVAAGRDVDSGRMFSLTGAAVIDELMDRAPTPTALMIDADSGEPFAVAPVEEVTPNCYVDVDQERIVVSG